MNRTVLVMAFLLGGAAAGGSLVAAETAAPKAAPQAAPSHQPGMGPGMGTMGGMGPGMGGMGMMGGMGPGMMGHMGMMGMADPETRIQVKNVDKGVTITLTATDPAKVTRLQKMAEAMRLMHEAMTQ